MKVWLIKRKGADWWGNYLHDYEIKVGKVTIYAQLCFYKKKDAVNYLESMQYKDFYEVVGKK